MPLCTLFFLEDFAEWPDSWIKVSICRETIQYLENYLHSRENNRGMAKASSAIAYTHDMARGWYLELNIDTHVHYRMS
jgi:hypothetical protein